MPRPDQPFDLSTLRLIGTIEAGDFSGAVLTDTDGKQTFYRLREPMPDGSRITVVRSDSLVIRRSDGTTAELTIIHGTASAGRQGMPQTAPTAVPTPMDAGPAGQITPNPPPPAVSGGDQRNTGAGQADTSGQPAKQRRARGSVNP